MSEGHFTIPFGQLPERFAESLDRSPAQAATPRPAATIVLLREGEGGLEVLLTQRVRTAAFVPGAYVFPGGRVDHDDGDAELVGRLEGITAEEAAGRLGLEPDADPSALAYYVAAIREAFEETGILVGLDRNGAPPPAASQDEIVAALCRELLGDEDAFPSILDRMGCVMDGAAVEYVAHWITPLAEPRRYDTRFFAALVPGGREPLIDPREMSDALWIAPEEALARNREGGLPMVFPTLKTLEALTGFLTPRGALDAFRGREIPALLPRLVRNEGGVTIELER